MKPQTRMTLIASILLSLSACTQNNRNYGHSQTQQNNKFQHASIQQQSNRITHASYRQQQTNNRHYPASRHAVAPTRVVYRPTNHAQRPVVYRQRVVHQQVRRPQVRIVRPPAPARNLNPAQANLAELYAIGDKIFNNETGGRIDQLVHWNEREDFASMGIGHFTWYPRGRSQQFGNTFPGLLDYLQQNGVNLPSWVQRARFEGAPWRSRGELMQAKGSPEVRQFAQLLYDTRHLQAKYIMDRAMRAMPRLVKTTPPQLRNQVAKNLNTVANSKGGRYVLIDYVNFKGEGLNRHGGYRGQNWGLLQVLEEMRPAPVGQPALNEFADAAMRVLERRVRNSNPRRNERKWLNGWRNRTNTYRNPI